MGLIFRQHPRSNRPEAFLLFTNIRTGSWIFISQASDLGWQMPLHSGSRPIRISSYQFVPNLALFELGRYFWIVQEKKNIFSEFQLRFNFETSRIEFCGYHCTAKKNRSSADYWMGFRVYNVDCFLKVKSSPPRNQIPQCQIRVPHYICLSLRLNGWTGSFWESSTGRPNVHEPEASVRLWYSGSAAVWMEAAQVFLVTGTLQCGETDWGRAVQSSLARDHSRHNHLSTNQFSPPEALEQPEPSCNCFHAHYRYLLLDSKK